MTASIIILARHAARVSRTGQVRFRLETFGLYHPALPYTTPWWKASKHNLGALLRQGRAYARWVVEMDRIRRCGGVGWWQQRDDGRIAQKLQAVLDAWNSPE